MNTDVSSAQFSDWEARLPDTDHVRFVKSIDWQNSDIGLPMRKWPIELLCWTQQCLADSRPTVIYCRSYTMIYNEAFIPMCGNVHPAAMGSTFQQIYPEILGTIDPMFRSAIHSRAATNVTEIHLDVMRNGFLEESYFTGSFTPIYTLDGHQDGIYNAVTEVTEQYIGDRRRGTLNAIPLSFIPLTTENVWNHMTEVLRGNGKDFPLVLLYQLEEQDQLVVNHRVNLRGFIGLHEQHPHAVSQACINDEVGFMHLLRQARNDVFTREITEEESRGVDWAGNGSPRPKYLSAAPLQNAGTLYGYVVVAMNPRRPISSGWLQFVLDLSRQLASTIASTVTSEEAARRERKLQNQLVESERQIRYMAQHSDISMQQLSLDRKTIWANQHFWNLVNQQDNTLSSNILFEDFFLETSRDEALKTWQQVIQGLKAHTTELELQRVYVTPDGGHMPTTILLSAFPYMVDGKVKSVMACMTEVSRLKWAESLQATIAQNANEAKMLQSQFTDAISHEVRNPLSAMLQLAEDILTTAASWQGRHQTANGDIDQVFDEITDAAKTLLVCARHQKRIVDDVLTLSKMDLANMTLNPTTIQPETLINHAVKVLEADAVAGGIKVTVLQESSTKALALEQVICDSLRVTQVLINLLSNAIKFTKLEAHRNITIRYGTALEQPQSAFPGVIRWASQNENQKWNHDALSGAEWGKGEFTYLTFQIEDTGLGMNEEEMQRVFERFEQASPQTSIKYGGSGLGLFICRILCQRHCGGIGVSSTVGKGTTLAFYVGSRRATAESPKLSEGISSAGHAESVSVAQNLQNVDDVATKRQIPQRPTTSTGKNLPHYRILLVEDNLINQRILCKQLKRAGCEVYVANHGAEALEFLRNTAHWIESDNTNSDSNHDITPSDTQISTSRTMAQSIVDVILMDINMPVMDGLTCTRQIRELERLGTIASHLQIIAVTANARHEQADEAQAAGVDAVLRKPFVVSELLEMVAKHLTKQK